MRNTHTHMRAAHEATSKKLFPDAVGNIKKAIRLDISVKSGHYIPNAPHWAEMNTIFPPLLIGG